MRPPGRPDIECVEPVRLSASEIHRSWRWRFVHRVRGQLEQSALIRVRLLAFRRTAGDRFRSIEPAHIAFELCAGDPAAASNVHRVEFAGSHEGVDGRATDAQHFGGLLGCQQQPLASQHALKPLLITYLELLAGRPLARAAVRRGTSCP